MKAVLAFKIKILNCAKDPTVLKKEQIIMLILIQGKGIVVYIKEASNEL